MGPIGPCTPGVPGIPIGPIGPGAPGAPVAPGIPCIPCGPTGPCGPTAPAEVIVISSAAAWPVSSFSLLSSRRLPAAEASANPKLDAGVVTQPCTSEVTSSVTNCPAARGVKLPAAAPIDGIVLPVTPDSLQEDVTGES